MKVGFNMNRTIAFKALVGSHNYNLATPESDKDYKVFVLPTFDDLYKGNQYSHSQITDTVDYDYHDIRKLSNLFWKSNLNFIEVLYSTDVIHSDIPWVKTNIDEIYKIKHELVSMNLPYLYRACKGMYFNKIKYLEKGTEGTQHLVDRFGYDTKQGLHAFRILDFIERFAETNFADFQHAMTYSDTERDSMLAIKNGLYTKEEYLRIVEFKLSSFEKLESLYTSQKENEDVKRHLEDIILGLVKLGIMFA